ncbi:flagellar hook-associated protein FlgK [bacterium]|nr:flagellar hook-associated protein FlgK [bacterium]
MIRGTYLGLESAKRGLTVAQAALDTVSHNVANANTEGFSRQRVDIVATSALPVPGISQGAEPGQIGTGVRVFAVTRIRDEFLEFVFRSENGVAGESEETKNGLENIESFFNEVGERGFAQVIENFFNAWEVLSNDPESRSTRANLRDVAQSFINSVQDIDDRFDIESRRLNEQIRLKVEEVNLFAKQIANLNEQISSIECSENLRANDLRDSRDLLVAQLSRLINVDVHEDSFSAYSVNVAGHSLVEKHFVSPLEADASVTSAGLSYTLKFSSGLPVNLTSGELSGLIKLREETLPDAWHSFNIVVSAMVNRVNELHRQGYGLDEQTNRDFFIDIVTRELYGLNPLPVLTGLDTKLSDAGVTSGDFFIGNERIVITDDDVSPDSDVTVGDILQAIADATDGQVRGELDTVGGTNGVILRLHNPPDIDFGGSASVHGDDIDAKEGTSNFLSALGIDPSMEVEISQDPPYVNISKSLALNPLIRQDLDAIAAARPNEDGGFSGPGDNRLALEMADLKNFREFVGGDSLSEYYRGTVVTIGVKVQEITRLTHNQNMIMEQINQRRESVSGVSLDEEAISMIKFQRALEAAARMISVADQILDRIINNMGYAGR